MFDHAFLEVVDAMRRGLSGALLERDEAEERLQVDILLGDVGWDCCYSLPGEGDPPRVRADIALDWPAWSQSLFRAATLGEATDDQPELGVELVLRIQRLARAVGTDGLRSILEVLPSESPALGSATLERLGPVLEEAFEDELSTAHPAVEVTYEGSVTVDGGFRGDPSGRDEQFAAFGRWVASSLVRLADLRFEYLPPEAEAS